MRTAASTGLKLLLSLLLFAVISEGMLRVQLFGTDGLTYTKMRSIAGILMSEFALEPPTRKGRTAGSRGLLPNTSGINYGVSFRVNNFGFRGPDTTRVPRPGVYRIAVLGGSTTMGWGVEEQDAWPTILEELANDGSLSWSGAGPTPPERVEVLNLGVPNTRRCLGVHLRRALYFQPHLILWRIGKSSTGAELQQSLKACHALGLKHRVPVLVFTAEKRSIRLDPAPGVYFKSLGSLDVSFGPEHHIYPSNPHPDGAIHRVCAERLAAELFPLLPDLKRLIDSGAQDYETTWRPAANPQPWKDPEDGFWKSYLVERLALKFHSLRKEARAAWTEVRELLTW